LSRKNLSIERPRWKKDRSASKQTDIALESDEI